MTNTHDQLVNVSIGVPEPDMNGWIDQVSWSHYIEPTYEEPTDQKPGSKTSSDDEDDEKYAALLKRKQQEKNEGN